MCEECKFYQYITEGEVSGHGVGECRKSPPILRDECNWVWPKVRGEDWCGEFVQSADEAAE